MIKSGEKNNAEPVEVSITTVPATYLRPGLEVDVPYECIQEVKFPDRSMVLPDVAELSIYDEGVGRMRYQTLLPRWMASRLAGYIYSRFLAPVRPRGNCHDFSSYLTGLDAEPLVATGIMNKLLPLGRPIIDQASEIPVGDIVLVGHPDHEMVGPMINGERHPDYSAAGHGRLTAQHSAVSVGVIAVEGAGISDVGPSEPHAIERMSIDGPLGITPNREQLRRYGELMTRIDVDCWADRQPPSPDELYLYHIPRGQLTAADEPIAAH